MLRWTSVIVAVTCLSGQSIFAEVEETSNRAAASKNQIMIRVQVLSMNSAEWDIVRDGKEEKLPLLEATTQDVVDRLAVYHEMMLAQKEAETTLVTVNRLPAQLRLGGEYPVPVPQAGGTNSIQWRQYGQVVQVRPIHSDEGEFEMDCAVENSTRDYTTAVEFDGFLIPGIVKRRVHDRVRLQPNQSVLAVMPGEDCVQLVLMTPKIGFIEFL